MKLFLSVIGVLILVNCSGKKGDRSIRTDTVSSPVAAIRTPDNDSVNEGSNRSGARAGMWTYEKTVDKTGVTVYNASVTSSNLLQFAYPYTGGSTATLVIREKDGSDQAYIEVANGQFNRSFQNGSARIRFDGKPPVTYSLVAAANGRANIVFFDGERSLINQIKGAKNMVVQVIFDGQPTRQIEFRTADLRWNH
ncbi:hypothetical protein [Spirosoma arcticum]